MIIVLTYLFVAIGLSFLCSVLEAVLLSTPLSFIKMKEKEGNKSAPLFLKLKSNIDRPVAAILSLNTIAHTVGAAGVGAEAVKIFGEAYFGIISAVLTLLILVFSEIIPKTIGACYWRALAMVSAHIMQWLIIITYPLVWLSEFITRVVTPKDKTASVSREEVSAMVSMGAAEGVFHDQENRIIQSCIRLSQVRAKEIMTPAVIVQAVSEKLTLKDFYDKEELLFSRVPVYADTRDYITGYILRTDVLEKLADDEFDCKVSDIARPVLSVNDKTSVLDIWQKLLERKELITIVVDDYGGMRGVITMEDVVETMLGAEIIDEDDLAPDLQSYAREKWERIRKKQQRVLEA